MGVVGVRVWGRGIRRVGSKDGRRWGEGGGGGGGGRGG